MRLALFASDLVGAQVAAFMAEQGAPPVCLVLDPRDPAGQNGLIAGAFRGTTLWADELTKESGLELLRSTRPDLSILAWWPAILPAEILRVPRLGTLNFHPSYLPYCRGKHYYFWSIVERVPFGVTIHWAEQRVDAGPIAFQRRVETSWTDTGASLYRKACSAMVDLFKECFPAILRGEIPAIPQDEAIATFHRADEMEKASKIELDRPYRARDLVDLLRARTFPPDGGARFSDEGREYKVTVEITRVEEPQ